MKSLVVLILTLTLVGCTDDVDRPDSGLTCTYKGEKIHVAPDDYIHVKEGIKAVVDGQIVRLEFCGGN